MLICWEIFFAWHCSWLHSLSRNELIIDLTAKLQICQSISGSFLLQCVYKVFRFASITQQAFFSSEDSVLCLCTYCYFFFSWMNSSIGIPWSWLPHAPLPIGWVFFSCLSLKTTRIGSWCLQSWLRHLFYLLGCGILTWYSCSDLIAVIILIPSLNKYAALATWGNFIRVRSIFLKQSPLSDGIMCSTDDVDFDSGLFMPPELQVEAWVFSFVTTIYSLLCFWFFSKKKMYLLAVFFCLGPQYSLNTYQLFLCFRNNSWQHLPFFFHSWILSRKMKVNHFFFIFTHHCQFNIGSAPPPARSPPISLCLGI